MLSEFERIYSEQLARLQDDTISPQLKPLMSRFYHALVCEPPDLQRLKNALIDLLEFLTTPEGRTNGNCRLVDFFICLGDFTYPELPDSFQDVIADMGGALHDTITSPEIAYNFDSTPEQLLARARLATTSSHD